MIKINKIILVLLMFQSHYVLIESILPRSVQFWSRAIRIYGSYKAYQISKFKTKLKGRRRNNKKNSDSSSNSNSNSNSNSLSWDDIHEENSKRMLDLCLKMKGFYLKTGQFLGTRHDFMPIQYIEKLSKLHDDVPPLDAKAIKKILKKELKGEISDYFTSIDLDKPIGSASIAQVHQGIWKKTGEKVAVKIQYPGAAERMRKDLRNLRVLAEFLQRTELKFDILSAIKELQKNIMNEFNFAREAKNMVTVAEFLAKKCPEVRLPKPIYHTNKVLIMSFVEGLNLGRIAEFKDSKANKIPKIMKQKFGTKLFRVLSKAWGEQIFELQLFNADPHPGNICITDKFDIGLLDWGQVKVMSDQILLKFSKMIIAINSKNQEDIIDAFFKLGVIVSNPNDKRTVECLAISMFDTKNIPGYIIDPFDENNALKSNSVTKLPPDVYFVLRTVQMFRGICFGLNLDYSLAEAWKPLAERAIKRLEKKQH